MGKEDSSPTTVKSLVYVVCLIGVFIEAGLFAAHRQTNVPAGSDVSTANGEVVVDHPIPQLMTEAEDKFRTMLARQSKTIEQAVTEYKRRYGRNPPKGFDKWFTWAVKNNVKMIDEYDAINEDLLPFMELSGEEMRRRIQQVCRRTVFVSSDNV